MSAEQLRHSAYRFISLRAYFRLHGPSKSGLHWLLLPLLSCILVAELGFGKIGFNIFTGRLLDMLDTSSIPVILLKVQEALEQELHLLGRQLHVRGALKQAPHALLISLAYLL